MLLGASDKIPNQMLCVNSHIPSSFLVMILSRLNCKYFEFIFLQWQNHTYNLFSWSHFVQLKRFNGCHLFH